VKGLAQHALSRALVSAGRVLVLMGEVAVGAGEVLDARWPQDYPGFHSNRVLDTQRNGGVRT
jgi:hypothetical protein